MDEHSEFDYKRILNIYEEQTTRINEAAQYEQEMREKFFKLMDERTALEKSVLEKENLVRETKKKRDDKMQMVQEFFQLASIMNSNTIDGVGAIESTEKKIDEKRVAIIELLKSSKDNLTKLYSQFEGESFSNELQNIDAEIEFYKEHNRILEEKIQSIKESDDKGFKYDRCVDLKAVFGCDLTETESKLNKTKAELVEIDRRIASHKKVLADKEK